MNVTAPTPETNRQFGKALGRALGRPALVWTPGFMLRLLLGGGAEVVIQGQRVLPKRALEWGYAFRFPTLDAALADIFMPAAKSASAQS
jgi:NAD dependent epimerase/dehydratase family enzyme